MIVWKAERDAGLGESLLAGTVAGLSRARLTKTMALPEAIQKKIFAQKNSSFAAKDQFDLHYLDTILVSAGWNLNDDVFAGAELWASRKTPEDKPWNYEHDCRDIIGHITANTPVDDDENPLDESLAADELPDSFHILTAGVLYKSWADAKLQERMDALVAEIAEGKWYVSMECLFRDFDYALKPISGGASGRVVARNGSTAFLTKHLRAYGGDGIYEGHRIGRLLRGITFSGKGLVRNPANPESVILTPAGADAKKFTETFVFPKEKFSPADIPVVYTLANRTSENVMDEKLLTKQIEDLKTENAALKASLHDSDVKRVREQLEAEQKAHAEALNAAGNEKKTLEDKVFMLENKVGEMAKAVEAMKTSLEEVEAKRAEAEKALTEAAEREKQAETKRMQDVRLEKAKKLNLEAEATVAWVANLEALTEEQFDSVLNAVAGTQGKSFTNIDEKNDKGKGGDKTPGKKPPQQTGLPSPTATPFKKISAASNGSADIDALDGVKADAGAALATADVPADGIRKQIVSVLKKNYPAKAAKE